MMMHGCVVATGGQVGPLSYICMYMYTEYLSVCKYVTNNTRSIVYRRKAYRRYLYIVCVDVSVE